MKKMGFAEAIDDALAQAMAEDKSIVIFGEDVHTLRLKLRVRFGDDRILAAPISESAFLGAAVTAAMSGLKPVVEIMLVDFVGVAMDAILNQAAKVKYFSGEKWNVPMVIRASCGGWYGDGGQHEQSLWGWFAHIPGLKVVVPSNPADAGGLMLSALEDPDPVVFLEHKLLSDYWLEYVGIGGRKTVKFDIPPKGVKGVVPRKWHPSPLGSAELKKEGKDITLISVGVGVHRALTAAEQLGKKGISSAVLDLRSVAPLDKKKICEAVAHTGRMLVIDEDYRDFGLSGELAAVVMEENIPFRFARVCTETTIPYARHLEERILPNTERIVDAATRLLKK